MLASKALGCAILRIAQPMHGVSRATARILTVKQCKVPLTCWPRPQLRQWQQQVCADLHHVHCRLSQCISCVIMYVKHTSVCRALQSGAAAETQQVTVRSFRVWCFRCCSGCTITFCQALALLCLLVNYVLYWAAAAVSAATCWCRKCVPQPLMSFSIAPQAWQVKTS